MLRKAAIGDVKKIQDLVNRYASRDMMLPLSLSELYDNLRSFYVYEKEGKIIGCGALHVSWEALGEIRSLVVEETSQGKGYGRQIITRCLAEGRQLGLERVFVLTYNPAYFRKLGFKVIGKDKLPHKVWRECIKCVHFPDCGEEALIISL